MPMLSGFAKRLLERTVARRGYQLVPARQADPRKVPSDLGDDAKRLFEQVRDYTMTTPERVAALQDAVRYVVSAGVPGAMVECGVWRGGSMMAVAHTLRAMGSEDRDLYLYDTFSGMPSPEERDVDLLSGVSAAERQARHKEQARDDVHPDDAPALAARGRAPAHARHRDTRRNGSTSWPVSSRRRSPVRRPKRSPCFASTRITTRRPATNSSTCTRASPTVASSSSTTTGDGRDLARRPTNTSPSTASTSCCTGSTPPAG